MQFLSSATKKQKKCLVCADKYWMRIALLISGEFREFEIAHKFWTFLQWKDVDIYWSTWKTSNIVYTEHHSIVEPINFKLIHSTNPKGVIVESQDDDNRHPAIKMIHRIKEGLKLVLESEYDVVMIIRPDLMIMSSDEYLRDRLKYSIENQKCLIDGYRPGASGDQFVILPVKFAREFLEYDFNQHIDFTSPWPLCDIHEMFAYFFKDNAEGLAVLYFWHAIVRVTARKLKPIHQQHFRRVLQTSAEWWETRNKLKYHISEIYDTHCAPRKLQG